MFLAFHLIFCLIIRENIGYAESNVERHVLARRLATANGPSDWHEALDIIAFGSPEQVEYFLYISCYGLSF